MMQELVRGWWRNIVEDKYNLIGAVAILSALLFFGGRQGYRMYVASRESAAQVVMAEAFEDYDKALYYALEGKDSKEVVEQRFEDAKIAFDGFLQNHSGSSLALYAMAFKADISLQKGDKQAAIATLEKALAGASVNAPGYYLIKTKLALVRLDDGQTDQALKALSDLAHEYNNPTSDMAAFYLGYYYWVNRDLNKAREAWKLLEQLGNAQGQGVSPWLAIAQGKLQQVS